MPLQIENDKGRLHSDATIVEALAAVFGYNTAGLNCAVNVYDKNSFFDPSQNRGEHENRLFRTIVSNPCSDHREFLRIGVAPPRIGIGVRHLRKLRTVKRRQSGERKEQI